MEKTRSGYHNLENGFHLAGQELTEDIIQTLLDLQDARYEYTRLDQQIKDLSKLPILSDSEEKKAQAVRETASAWETVIWEDSINVWKKRLADLRAKKEARLKEKPKPGSISSEWDRTIQRYRTAMERSTDHLRDAIKDVHNSHSSILDKFVDKESDGSLSFSWSSDNLGPRVAQVWKLYLKEFTDARNNLPAKYRKYFVGGKFHFCARDFTPEDVDPEKVLDTNKDYKPDLTFSRNRSDLETLCDKLQTYNKNLNDKLLGRESVWFTFTFPDTGQVKETFFEKLFGVRKQAKKYFASAFDSDGFMYRTGPFGHVCEAETDLRRAIRIGFWASIRTDLNACQGRIEKEKEEAEKNADSRYNDQLAAFNKSLEPLDAEIKFVETANTGDLFDKGYLPITSADRLRELRAGFKSNKLSVYGISSDVLEDVYAKKKWRGYGSRKQVEQDLANKLNASLKDCEKRNNDALLAKKKALEDKKVQMWEEFRDSLAELQEVDPVLCQLPLSEERIPWLLDRMQEQAATRFDIWNYGLPDGLIYDIGAESIYAQEKMMDFDEEAFASGLRNLRYDYSDDTEERAYMALNRLLLSLLMSLPVGQVRLHFVDLNLSNKAPFYTQRLDPKLLNRVTDEAGFRTLVNALQEKTVRLSRSCADVVAYHREHESFLASYDLVVILDAPKNLSSQHVRTLLPLLENGAKGGVFFLLMNNTGITPEHGVDALFKSPWIIRNLDDKSENFTDKEPDYYRFYYDDEAIREACVDRLNAEIGEAAKTRVLRLDTEAAVRAPYAPTTGGLSVEVGGGEGGPMEFRMDLESHVHAFVLGQSGSGKSVFLRDVILGSVLKYSPADLQLYLIDLKVGGVEFNGYQRLPHTKAALLDDSDRQIVLEILRNLREELRKRGVLFREAGVGSVAEYNAAHPQTHLPQTLIVVDECQRLFGEKADRIQTEMNSILDDLATMGRSYGVHLILATQTLHGSTISAKVRKNVSDFYLLKGGIADGLERMGDEAAVLQTGQVLYTDRAQKTQFQAYLIDGKQKESLVDKAIEKAKGQPDNGRFCFMGKMQWHLDKTDAEALRSQSRRNLTAALGRKITMDLGRMTLRLEEDMSQNVLVLGSHGMDAVQLAQQIYLSLMLADTGAQRPHKFLAIDNLNNPELPYAVVAEALEKHGSQLVAGRSRGEAIYALAQSVRAGKAEPTIVLMLGQERFTQLLAATDLPGAAAPAAQAPAGSGPSFMSEAARPVGGLGGLGSGRLGTTRPTYRTELQYLLETGPEMGVHFIWEVDRLPNLLGDANLSKQSLLKMFRHVILLRSLPETVLRMGLPQEIDPDTLSDDPDRMRAYYVDLLDNRYQLFTPYAPPAVADETELLFTQE